MPITEVTLGDFAKMARRRGLTPECLAERFREKIERPAEFFHRVFEGQYAAVVIPFRSVLKFYLAELHYHQDSVGSKRVCACGCGSVVFDRSKWATSACRKRVARKRVSDQQIGVG